MKSEIKILILSFLNTPSFSLAVSEGIPVSFILFQVLNFGIFLAIVVFFVVKKAPSLLMKKYQDFLEMSQRSQKMFEQAQKQNHQIKEKIKNIEKQMTQIDSVIQEGAQSIKDQTLKEIQKICSIIHQTTQNLLNREHIRLKQSLLEEMLEQMRNSCEERQSRTTRFLNRVQKRKVE